MQDKEEERITLMCQVDDARIITKILSAIHFKQNQTATVVITEGGLKVYTESAQVLQASGWLRKELFSDFEYHPPDDSSPCMFGCNLTILLQCLSTMSDESLGNSTAVKLCYAGPGNPLVLMLEEDGVMTDCGLRTLVADEPLDFEFVHHSAPNKLILRSEVLKDAFTEFDLINSGLHVSFKLDESEKFTMSVNGPLSACEIEIPGSSEIVSKLECYSPQTFRYRLSMLMLAIKSLSLSRDTCIRMNSKGVLSMQFMILLSNQQTAVVEFLVCASVEEEEEGLAGDQSSRSRQSS